MRVHVLPSVLFAALACGGARGDEPPPADPPAQSAVLEERLADLERRLAEVERLLQDIRRELQAGDQPEAAPLTPDEAVASFQQDPDRRLLVEFGVESAGWPDAPIPVGEDPMPPVMADWDGRLSNGAKFTLLLTAKAIRGLKDIGVDLPPAEPAGVWDIQRLDVVCKHLKGKGVRVTGRVQASRPDEKGTDYYIVVDDADDFRVNR